MYNLEFCHVLHSCTAQRASHKNSNLLWSAWIFIIFLKFFLLSLRDIFYYLFTFVFFLILHFFFNIFSLITFHEPRVFLYLLRGSGREKSFFLPTTLSATMLEVVERLMIKHFSYEVKEWLIYLFYYIYLFIKWKLRRYRAPC